MVVSVANHNDNLTFFSRKWKVLGRSYAGTRTDSRLNGGSGYCTERRWKRLNQAGGEAESQASDGGEAGGARARPGRTGPSPTLRTRALGKAVGSLRREEECEDQIYISQRSDADGKQQRRDVETRSPDTGVWGRRQREKVLTVPLGLGKSDRDSTALLSGGPGPLLDSRVVMS